MFPNGNVGLENSKFYEDVPARGHNAFAGRHELASSPDHKTTTQGLSSTDQSDTKSLPLATDDSGWVLDSQHGRADNLSSFLIQEL